MKEMELSTVCNDIFPGKLKISIAEAKYLEESTKLQSQCSLWHEHRVGRITASRFYRVSKASTTNPPKSLVNGIMHAYQFNPMKVPALKWGIDNESNARNAYISVAEKSHDGFCFQPAGLFINLDHPHLGASPDGLISCKCCGEGLIEIKCPYKFRDQDPRTVVADKTFYLEEDKSGIHLSYKHEYYVQIQGQLSICERDYCDFICWTPHGMFIERIIKDETFDSIKPLLDKFFKNVLLPRLLTGSNCTKAKNDDVVLYCWCQKEEYGNMVECDNPDCPREWCHFECVGLTRKPC